MTSHVSTLSDDTKHVELYFKMDARRTERNLRHKICTYCPRLSKSARQIQKVHVKEHYHAIPVQLGTF